TDMVGLIKGLITGFPKNKVTFKSSEKEIWVHVRHNAFRRCVTNLIDNALRYAGKTWVSVTQEPHRILVRVEDDGPGIPKEARQEVFRPFYRLEQSRNTATGGNGLGLAIAQDIVHAHGGKMSLDDTSQGGLRVT